MPTRSAYAPGTFCWADLSTTDAGAARRFYADLLGWEFEGPLAMLEGAPVAAVNEQHMHASHWNSYVAVESAGTAAARAQELGATVIEPAFDVAPFGRLSLMRDPGGATFCVWEAGDHPGAGRVNEPGALCWNHLETPDVEAAQRFYAGLFGWTWNEAVCFAGERMNGSASASDGPPAWSAVFGVADLERAQAGATELGGALLSAPAEFGPGRFIVIADPTGAAVSLYQGGFDD